MNKSEIVRQLLQNSPFLNFRKEELQKIDLRYRSGRNIYVRFGYPWKDSKGKTQKTLSSALADNLKKLFHEAMNSASNSNYKMVYGSLRAEAGMPVLHRIVFDILSADILFFDVSYLNPNVFFELGVAYAVNTRLFLLRRADADAEVPSDLAGLTYCKYSLDGDDLRFDRSSQTDIAAAMKKAIKDKAELNSDQ